MGVKINLGAGGQYREGWINYDRSRVPRLAQSSLAQRALKLGNRAGLVGKAEMLEWPEGTRVHDLRKGIPHGDSSVDVVYSSHMLEHFTAEQARALLEEAYRVLKPGGLVRIVVPDLAHITRAYLEGDRESLKATGDVPLADAYLDGLFSRGHRSPGPVERLARAALRTEDGGHKWMYDAESLGQRLREAGFVEVQQVARGEGRDPDAAALDVRSAHGLHFEAIKPL